MTQRDQSNTARFNLLLPTMGWIEVDVDLTQVEGGDGEVPSFKQLLYWTSSATSGFWATSTLTDRDLFVVSRHVIAYSELDDDA